MNQEKDSVNEISSASDDSGNKSKPHKVLTLSVSIASAIFGFSLVKFLGAAGFGFLLMMLLTCFLGSLAAKKLFLKHDAIAKIVIWSNVVMWLIPAFGFFSCAAAFELTKDRSKYSVWFVVLASVGLVLSIVNGIQGVLVGIEMMNQMQK